MHAAPSGGPSPSGRRRSVAAPPLAVLPRTTRRSVPAASARRSTTSTCSRITSASALAASRSLCHLYLVWVNASSASALATDGQPLERSGTAVLRSVGKTANLGKSPVQSTPGPVHRVCVMDGRTRSRTRVRTARSDHGAWEGAAAIGPSSLRRAQLRQWFDLRPTPDSSR